MPEVSVVIPTHRRPHLVTRAVLSVLRQTYTSFEVVVVIDGVDDGTRAALAGLGDARVRVVETGQNQGPAGARNIGAEVATGTYLALLDDDDEWTPEKLERQMQRVSDFGGKEFLMSCRVIGRTPKGDYVWPERLYRMGEDIGEYLLDPGPHSPAPACCARAPCCSRARSPSGCRSPETPCTRIGAGWSWWRARACRS